MSTGDILWYHTPALTNESIPLDNTTHHLIMYNASSSVLTLHIANVSYSDRGSYTARASNEAGSFVSTSIYLNIQSECEDDIFVVIFCLSLLLVEAEVFANGGLTHFVPETELVTLSCA